MYRIYVYVGKIEPASIKLITHEQLTNLTSHPHLFTVQMNASNSEQMAQKRKSKIYIALNCHVNTRLRNVITFKGVKLYY